MQMLVEDLKRSLADLANPEKAKILQKFFKTGKGEYGEGDVFLGVTVPLQRKVALGFYQKINLEAIQQLLGSEIHEHRLTAVLMLVLRYEHSKNLTQKHEIATFYVQNAQKFNNWDLVDSGCYKILGHYCFHQEKEEILLGLAESENLWKKRISVVSSLYFIKQNALETPIELILINLHHKHDLMHKANGWMLRELGKKDEVRLKDFLDEYATQLPRTTLRYAIERLEPTLRKYYLELR